MFKQIYSKNGIILGIMSIIFFILYNFLNFSIPGYFNSPDENANLAFINQFAGTNTFAIPHQYDYGRFAEFIHPRSTFVQGANVVPVSFWGLFVVYGFLAKLVGHWVVLVTSVLTIASAWAFYGIIRRVFNDRVGLYSSILFFFHPAIWYYSARSLFPNVPFTALLIIGAYILIARPLKNIFNDIIGALIIALGFLIRPNEAVWVAIAVIIIYSAFRKEIPFKRFATWWIIWIASGFIYVYVNSRIFGSGIGAYVSSTSITPPSPYSLLLPFGFDATQVLRSVYFFFIRLVWWFTIPAIIGGCLLLWEWYKGKINRTQKVFVIVALVSMALLFVYYGDALDLLYQLKSIGVSYPRYWVPAFVFSLPFIGVLLERIWVWLKGGYGGTLALFGLFVLMFIVSTGVVYGGVDGLTKTRENLLHAKEVESAVLAETDPRAVIVTDRDDKFFWPAGQVMVRFRDPAVGKAIGDMVWEGWPMYYFTPVLNEVEKKDVDAYIQEFGVGLEKVRDFSPHELYGLHILQNRQ